MLHRAAFFQIHHDSLVFAEMLLAFKNRGEKTFGLARSLCFYRDAHLPALHDILLSTEKCRSTTGANLPARLFEEYDNMAFLVSRLRMPVSLGDLVQ